MRAQSRRDVHFTTPTRHPCYLRHAHHRDRRNWYSDHPANMTKITPPTIASTGHTARMSWAAMYSRNAITKTMTVRCIALSGQWEGGVVMVAFAHLACADQT